VLAALVAVTTQVVAPEALSWVVDVIEQPVPVTPYVTPPLPDPPDVESVIAVPAVPVRVVLAIVRVVCATGAAAKTKLLVADVATRKPVLASFVAVTTQVVALAALSCVVDVIEQPVPVTPYVTLPLPDPPEVESVIAVPAVPVSVVLAIVRVACGPTGEMTVDAGDNEDKPTALCATTLK